MAGVESDYSSSSDEDDDYVPSGEDESYDELEGTVEEEEGIQEIDGGKQKKNKTKDSTRRRRKAWTALVDEGKDDTAEADEVSSIQRELEEAEKEEARRKKEEAEKKKADDLWSSFLSDVKQKPKSSRAQNDKAPKSMVPSSQKTSTKQPATPTSQPNGSKANSTLKITKVFDFAGEAVKVTKEVAASSKEAKSYLKEQEVKDSPAKSDIIPGSSSSTGSAVVPGSLGSSSKPTIASGLKRSGGGLGNVLGQIGKKHKIGTLEKSCLDWESFKSKEGITDELKIHNRGKDGFVERQRFLQRTDVRQYEIERELRMKQSKVLR